MRLILHNGKAPPLRSFARLGPKEGAHNCQGDRDRKGHSRNINHILVPLWNLRNRLAEDEQHEELNQQENHRCENNRRNPAPF